MKTLSLTAARRRNKVVILTGLAYGSCLSRTTGRKQSLTQLMRKVFALRTCEVMSTLGAVALWLALALDSDTGLAVTLAASLPWMIGFAIHETTKGGAK